MFQLQKLFNKFSLNKFITKCTSDSNLKSVLNNRVLLYGLSVLVLLDIFYLANSRDYNTIIIFVLVGFLTSFFCKNMIVIMFIALCIAHILKNPSSFEGAANMDEEDEEDKKEEHTEVDTENMEGKDDNADETKDKKDKDHTTKGEIDSDDKIKGELQEFSEVQKEIIAGLTKLEPLINKADSFIEKFEKYSKSE
jgi:hypothetical protein